MGNRTRLDTTTLHLDAQKLKHFLESRLISQRRAIDAVVTAYNRFCSPLWTPRGPIIALLSMGPSGSGKTYLAELLAEYFFNDRTGMTKIACADYIERHEISKLIGAPPGYIGHGQAPRLAQGKLNATAMLFQQNHDSRAMEMEREIKEMRKRLLMLTNPVEALALLQEIEQKKTRRGHILAWNLEYARYPIGILLFDEFEKANEALMHFLLEVTERGSATLANGDPVDLTKFFVIMTSNIASSQIARATKDIASIGFQTQNRTGGTDQAIYQKAIAAARTRFSPEFLNRVVTVVYRVLSLEELAIIRDHQLEDLEHHLHQADFPVTLVMSQAVKDFILQASSDRPEHGAREVSRKMDKYIRDNIDKAIASGGIVSKQATKVLLELEDSPDGPVVVLYREDEP